MKTAWIMALVAGLAVFWFGEGRIAGQCGGYCAPCDNSQVTYGPDTCGNMQYELIVVMTDGPEYDEGPASSFGACYEVRNCDGTEYSGVQDGGEVLTDLNDGYDFNYEADQFYWTLDDWTVSYTAKSCSNGYQGVTNYTLMRNPYETQTPSRSSAPKLYTQTWPCARRGGKMSRIAEVAAAILIAATTTAAQAAGGKASMVYYPALPHPHVIITNNYSSPVVGLLVVTQETSPNGRRGTGVGILDTGVNWPHDRPILPKAAFWLNVGHWVGEDPSTLHPVLAAVVFEDGTSIGDPAWVAIIRGRWKAAYDPIGAEEGILRQAEVGHATLDDAVASAKKVDTSSYVNRQTFSQLVQSSPVRQAAALVVTRTVDNLQGANISGVVGSPQLTIPAVVTNFNEWRGVLAALLKPAAAPSP